ncbi:hypothetical protein EDD18DRAFT_1197113 [Armillaria luteobubalina]|uniref:Ubiquitin 3 binding protein But2 C-terminal domain-containing protein n=1 Tax=Armillaria luteobubalina TaxID=153913 RepID=A0AA39PJI1_9AGAR|nr:hypothetical protein EDD18DRAFT_1197113 [Armillaria luteobubalina]
MGRSDITNIIYGINTLHLREAARQLTFRRSHIAMDSNDAFESQHLLEEESNERISKPNISISIDWQHKLTVFLSVFVVAGSIIQLSLTLYIFRLSPSPQVVAFDSLPMAHSYANLGRLYSNTSVQRTQHHPIISHARSFAQVSSASPDEVIPSHRNTVLFTSNGFTPLFERRLVVNDEISTIAQFRVLDFGMENCTIAIATPSHSAYTDIISGGAVSLDVWSIPHVKRKLNMKSVSYSSFSVTRSFLGSLLVSREGISQTPAFPCASGSYHTFEITCSQPGCNLDIVGIGNKASGLFMRQYQTI